MVKRKPLRQIIKVTKLITKNISRTMDKTTKFSPLCRILPSHHPLLSSPRSFDADRVLAEGKLHSSESVRRTTQFLFYDRWREITLEYFGEEALLGIRER